MKIAVVFDAPRSTGDPFESGVGGQYITRTFAACASAAGVAGEVEVKSFYAVLDPQPGGKAAPIATVRKDRDRLWRDIFAWGPDRILSVGASALNAVDSGKRALTISKERGRMRLASGIPWVPTISHLAVVKSSDLHRDFAYDVYKVLSQSAPLPAMDIELHVPDDLRSLTRALRLLEGASAIGVDVETTGLHPATDELLAVGFGATYDDRSGIAVIVKRDLITEAADLMWDVTWRKSRRSVGHNFKFDMQFLTPLVGWAPDGAMIGDTLLLGHLLDERPNRPTSRVRGLGLKDMVATRYDHEYGFDFAQGVQDFDALHSYLGEDVVYTARLWHDLWEEAGAESANLQRCHEELLTKVSRAIAKCEFAGAPIDVEWTRATVDAYDRRIARLRGALERVLGRLTSRQVGNVLAPAQIADVMYDDWKMSPDVRKHGHAIFGDRSTDKDHVKAAVAKYLGTSKDREARWLRGLERLRRDVRQRTTYQKSLLDRVDSDERVRAGFLIHGTSTGRLSSQGPNLQNVPAIDREDAIQFRPMRRAFRPKPGRFWVEVDYSQLELRVAAALSGDAALIEVFRSGRDVHREIATGIFSKPADQISKSERFLAKAVSFGIIYGRGAKALASGAEMRYVEQKLGGKAWTEQQADAFIRKFLRTYPQLSEWMDRLYDEVPKAGYVQSAFGRRRRFPLYPTSKGELGSIQRQAVNTPVQSAASDICLTALVEIQRGVEWYGIDATVLFPVHDSICIEVAEAEVDILERLCRREMEKDFMGVPLRVDFEYGPTWADVKDHTPKTLRKEKDDTDILPLGNRSIDTTYAGKYK